MQNRELARRTAYYRENIGDSLLLVKCYELLGRDQDARQVADSIARTELEALTRMVSQALGLPALSEQFLRVIYAFQSSGAASDAAAFGDSFLAVADRDLGHQVRLDDASGFRLCIAQVLLEDHTTSVYSRLEDESFSARLARAWEHRDAQSVETCLAEIQDYTDSAENEGDLVPWSDVWHYILAHRLEEYLHRVRPQ